MSKFEVPLLGFTYAQDWKFGVADKIFIMYNKKWTGAKVYAKSEKEKSL